MLIIGLTGGIGSGKSAVEKVFCDLGVTVIDADTIAHSLSEPGKIGYQAIVEHFGAVILQPNGQIDRRKLRNCAFDNEAERDWLELTLHPMIRHEMKRQAREATSPYCVLSIPLLTETMSFDDIDRVLVIDAPEELQIARCCERDHSSPEQIQKIIQTQNSRDQRLAYADDVIVNDETLEDLQREVEFLHQCYLKLSATKV
jgi:dephospho-CoA kinase